MQSDRYIPMLLVLPLMRYARIKLSHILRYAYALAVAEMLCMAETVICI